jgi:hypothetical protein
MATREKQMTRIAIELIPSQFRRQADRCQVGRRIDSGRLVREI